MNQLATTSTFTAEYAGLPSEIAGKIVQMVKHRQACDMEDLLEACPPTRGIRSFWKSIA